MITLAMDTSARWLNLALFRDDDFLDGCSEPAFKKQSELIFVRLNELLEKNKLDYSDIHQIVITKGPGSYTGLRIAMSIAKVLASFLDIDLFVISSFQLYTGMQSGHVLLDARAHRAFYAEIDQGKIVDQGLFDLDVIAEKTKDGLDIYGDAHLLDQPSKPSDFLENFMALKPYWSRVDQIHTLKPEYFKEYLGYA